MKRCKVLVCVLLLASFAFGLQKAEIETTMQMRIDESISILQKTKDKSAAAAEIFKLFDSIFDYKLMAKLSLSKAFETLSKEQQSTFEKAFEAQLKKSFTNKLSLYTNEKIIVSNLEQKNDKRIFLNAYTIIDGERKDIIFKFYDKAGGAWLIYDVDVLGVSIVQTYRSQFADLLSNEGFEVLLQKLESTDFDASATKK